MLNQVPRLDIMARYDWLIDREPACQGSAETGDVSSAVQVCVQSQTANGTMERMFLSDTDITAPTAHLARVLRRNFHNGLAQLLALVINERFELSIGPASEHTVEPLTHFLGSIDVQVFQCDNLSVRTSDCLRYTMVYVSLEPSLSSSQSLELPLGRPSAYRLQSLLHECISTTNVSESTGIKELPVGRDSDIIDTPVDTYDHWIINLFDRYIGNLHNQVNDYNIGPFPSPECNHFTGLVFPEIIRENERDSLSARNRGHRNNFFIEENAEGSLIEPGRAVILFHWPSLILLPFQHVTGTIPGSLNEARLEPGPYLPGFVITESLEPVLGVSLVIESEAEKVIGAIVERLDGLGYISIRAYTENDCTPQTHPTPISDTILFIHTLQFLPGLKTGVSLEEIL